MTYWITYWINNDVVSDSLPTIISEKPLYVVFFLHLYNNSTMIARNIKIMILIHCCFKRNHIHYEIEYFSLYTQFLFRAH